MERQILDITPDPKVLLALTHTPLKPLDALCELIDNGIDAFKAADMAGTPIPYPLLEVTVPGAAQARRGEGVVRIVDNGAGLDREALADTLRAGFSGKNRYDTLGLFGMGFNIATGKLGRKTTVTTARMSDEFALRVELDLPKVVRSKKFEVPVQRVEKPEGFEHGTIIEVSHWWPDGDPNAGFITQLASIPKLQLRQQIGRRYATILRRTLENRYRIRLNNGLIEPFEHCVWSEVRHVERQGWGMIPARIAIDDVIYNQRRCIKDGSVLDLNSNTCLECGSEEFRTVEERIRGWVGIQRFDDNNKFGIDLIRNGRTIRVGEKDAFFNYVNELGEALKEYPTDQQTGRIIGEVHLDHVPVDFQKQDFQRTTEEWQRAMEHLRGGSLLPSNWNIGTRNDTPVSKLFQGFRKVRNYGRQDMYMGRYDEASKKAVRIAREVEAEYYTRFTHREPGYYDDKNWWELVETATTPPVLSLEECRECGFQNNPGADECGECGRLIHAKECVSCSVEIARSATQCSACGASQIPEVKEPWHCAVCGATNEIDESACGVCNELRGAENPMKPEVIRQEAELIPDLSFDNRSFEMSDGRRTEPIDVKVFRTGPLRPYWNKPPIPTVALRSPGALEIFLYDSHETFTQLQVSPQEAVAVEVAQYLYSMRSDLYGRPSHSVINISSTVLADLWGEKFAAGPEREIDGIRALFEKISDRLAINPNAMDFYEELDQFDQRELADKLISAGLLDKLAHLRQSGGYLRYVSLGVIAKFFSLHPDEWFGTVWVDTLPDPASVGEAAAANARDQLIGIYRRCLDDCAAYLRFRPSDRRIMARVSASREYLEAQLA